jgi:NAD(P)-dependent dehydrogenase (short-subunit alcohol dehydrogenase family)
MLSACDAIGLAERIGSEAPTRSLMSHDSGTHSQSRQRRGLITGAGSGLGRAIAIQLGREGWELALGDIDVKTCEETAQQVRAIGGRARVELLDIASADQWSALVSRLKSQWSVLDLLVNVAGISAEGNVGDFPLANWRQVLDVNLLGAIYGCHFCRDWLVANPAGAHVINVASAAPFFSGPSIGAYSVSKAGVISLSETLYAELRPCGVGVSVVCPGFFLTNLLRDAHFQHEQVRALAERMMRNAPITAEDVARAAVRAIRRKQLYVVLPFRMRMLWWLRRLFPTPMMRLVAWMGAKRTAILKTTATS